MNKKLALVVDDRENWRTILEMLLRRQNFNVCCASNFEEANEQIEATNFDLAIFDARLIDSEEFNLDGIRLLSIIKNKTPSVKTILISDYPESFSENSDMLEENLPENADAFMYKVPKGKTFDKNKLNAIIEIFFGKV